MTDTVYSADVLSALLVTSPRRARLACLWPSSAPPPRPPGIPDGAALCTPRWKHSEVVTLATAVWYHGNALFLAYTTSNAQPEAFRGEVRAQGLHMRAAVAKDGLWRGLNRPVEAQVIVPVEEFPGHYDYALYSLGGEIEEEGEALYRRALAKLEQAIRDGWPGWSDAGMRTL